MPLLVALSIACRDGRSARHKARDAEVAKLRGFLEMMYERWASGVDCYEITDDNELGASIGNAVELTGNEENEILAALKEIGNG